MNEDPTPSSDEREEHCNCNNNNCEKCAFERDEEFYKNNRPAKRPSTTPAVQLFKEMIKGIKASEKEVYNQIALEREVERYNANE